MHRRAGRMNMTKAQLALVMYSTAVVFLGKMEVGMIYQQVGGIILQTEKKCEISKEEMGSNNFAIPLMLIPNIH